MKVVIIKQIINKVVFPMICKKVNENKKKCKHITEIRYIPLSAKMGADIDRHYSNQYLVN